MRGRSPSPTGAAYCSAKAGQVNLTRVLALEWAKHGIDVNAVGPTFVKTPLTEQRLVRCPAPVRGHRSGVIGIPFQNLPVRRHGVQLEPVEL